MPLARPVLVAVTVVAGASLAGASLAACGTARSPGATTSSTAPMADGVITGVATPCHPQLTTAAEYRRIPVTVTLSRGGSTVAQQTVTGNHVYRFVVPAGPYVVSSDGLGGIPPTPVDVAAGGVVRANLGTACI